MSKIIPFHKGVSNRTSHNKFKDPCHRAEQPDHFVLTDETGNKTEYILLFSFEHQDMNKEYWVYTDGMRDESGMIQVYASIREKTSSGYDILQPINTEIEWEMIEQVIDFMKNEANKYLNGQN